MWFLPPITDVRTLEYLKKSMSHDQREKAEAEGAFDLLKARDRSHLHPEMVTVHGPRGDYRAVRLKSNDTNSAAEAPAKDDVPDAVKRGKAMMDRLKKMQSKGKGAKTEQKAEDDPPKKEGTGKGKTSDEAKPRSDVKKNGGRGTSVKSDGKRKQTGKTTEGTKPVKPKSGGQNKPDGKKQTKAKPKPKKADYTQEELAVRFKSKGISRKLQKSLENRFVTAPPEAQRAFDKYAVHLDSCLMSTTRTGKYFITQDRLCVKASEDVKGTAQIRETAGSVTFHELGHLIDHRAKKEHPEVGTFRTISNDPKFLDAIRADVQAAEDAMKEKMKAEGIKQISRNDVRERVFEEIVMGATPIKGEKPAERGTLKWWGYLVNECSVGMAHTSGIQDIFGGAHHEKYVKYSYGHRPSYWNCSDQTWALEKDALEERKNEKLGTEAFANMFEACSNKETEKQMKKWLPTAYNRFMELLADIGK